jgi:hypothetical protein
LLPTATIKTLAARRSVKPTGRFSLLQPLARSSRGRIEVGEILGAEPLTALRLAYRAHRGAAAANARPDPCLDLVLEKTDSGFADSYFLREPTIALKSPDRG